MKIGVCTSPDKLPLLTELKYDYFEACFSWLTDLNDEDFRTQTAQVEKYPLAGEVYNIFFRGGAQLYAPDGKTHASLRAVTAFAEKGFFRAAAWGGKIAVIGSGFVRGLREDMSREETDRQFARVLNVCGEAAARHGMKIVVEPLSRNECNYIHTVAEGAAAARMADHPAVGVLADFYHHAKNGDDLDSLPQYADLLYHTHYARLSDRGVPQEEDREQIFRLAELLKQCPKAGRNSLECSWSPDFDTAVRSARDIMEIFR